MQGEQEPQSVTRERTLGLTPHQTPGLCNARGLVCGPLAGARRGGALFAFAP
jgi:hypothetical protein